MGEIVNLRRVKKARDRADAARAAAENRAKHSQSRGGRAMVEAEATRQRAALDGARLDVLPIDKDQKTPVDHGKGGHLLPTDDTSRAADASDRDGETAE